MGNSTLPCLARWRRRIQPEAMQSTGSARRLAHLSATALGGPSTMAPTSADLFATVAGKSGPSDTPNSSYSAQSGASAPCR